MLPLILENVVNHTETDRYAVDKDDTVEAFLRTIGDARGQYSINTAPDIIPIPTPIPYGQSKCLLTFHIPSFRCDVNIPTMLPWPRIHFSRSTPYVSPFISSISLECMKTALWDTPFQPDPRSISSFSHIPLELQ